MARKVLTVAVALATAMLASAMPVTGSASSCASQSSDNGCTRDFLTGLVDQVLGSMVAKDPYSLPLASIYKATENSHPAALSFMTSWRTITKASSPSILALDTTQCAAYFSLDISEGSDEIPSVLRGRVQLADQQITELELFINRGRGDHGFSFSAEPGDSTGSEPSTLCQIERLRGVYGNGSSIPLGCAWPDDHPTDDNARVGLVIDEELGFVLTSGIVPGKVYPYYGNISAFIPNDMTPPQEAQEAWIEEVKAQSNIPLLAPTEAPGDTLELLQYYDDGLQAVQINVYLSGPNATSVWL